MEKGDKTKGMGANHRRFWAKQGKSRMGHRRGGKVRKITKLTMESANSTENYANSDKKEVPTAREKRQKRPLN